MGSALPYSWAHRSWYGISVYGRI